MESGDEANNDKGHNNSSATTADSNGNSHGRPHQVVDNTDAAVSAGAGPTCLCGHRSSAVPGTSSSSSSELPPLPVISLTVAPTTGGQFELKVSKLETIDNLKKTISKRLKVPKERICLLWKDRHLRDGTLREHGVCDGSRLTLLPSVETGLLTQRPEQSVMQALESLNDSQVNDFLSGKAPLNLTMRLGDHMMLIQLQLSAVAPTASSSAHRRPAVSHHQPSTSSASSSSSNSGNSSSSRTASSTAAMPEPGSSSSGSSSAATAAPLPSTSAASGLSAMLNAPLRQTLPTPPPSRAPSPSFLAAAAKAAAAAAAPPTPSAPPTVAAAAPLVQPKLEKPATPAPTTSAAAAPSSSSTASTSASASSGSGSSAVPPPAAPHPGCGVTGCVGCETCDTRPVLDTRALAEASRNLTQTLKQLSSEVLTSRSTNESSGRSRRRQGAIIESMHHHGKGVYSGTFSGTLNPALQDRQGRPKRDISTIIHILNDLLCATPQYRRVLNAHAAAAAAAAQAAAANAVPTPASSSGSSSSNSASGSSSQRQTPTPMEQDDTELAAAAAQMAAAAALHRKTPEETRRLAEENQATRGKLEQLRMVMEERRARRRARREARAAPYSTTWSSKNGAASSVNTLAGGCGAGFGVQAHANTAAGSLDCEAAAASSDSSMDTSDASSTAELVRELNTEPVVA